MTPPPVPGWAWRFVQWLVVLIGYFWTSESLH